MHISQYTVILTLTALLFLLVLWFLYFIGLSSDLFIHDISGVAMVLQLVCAACVLLAELYWLNLLYTFQRWLLLESLEANTDTEAE